VTSFEVQPHKPFAMIVATPKAALDKIREVLIVWSDPTSVPLSLPPATPATSDAESIPNVSEVSKTKATSDDNKVEKIQPDTVKATETEVKTPILLEPQPNEKVKIKGDAEIKPVPAETPDESSKTTSENDLEDSIVDDLNVPASVEKSEADAIELNKLLPEIRMDSTVESDANE
jgi:hypothetical protein